MARRTLLLAVAHPDDDAYGLAGTVALHGDGIRFVLVHATAGEGGDLAPGFPATRETLGAVRMAEDEAAWAELGRVPDRHVWLGHPDGGVADLAAGRLADELTDLLAQERPDVVATFGPDGITGHPDHIAMGAATDAAFHRVRATPGPGLRRLLHGALPQSVFERWNAGRSAAGLRVWDPAAVYDLRGVPDVEIGVTVDTSGVADRIVRGLRQHRSQVHVMGQPDHARWERQVGREHLVVAWPPRPPGAPVLPDVFADVD